VFRKIGYFEAFDSSRACLNKPVTSFDTTGYTHIHLAFATITPDWNVDVSSIHGQFIDFIHMTGFKRILSFGGWTFSTDPSTYFLFREAMEAAHRDTLVANVVAFVKQYNLDGVDFDWEYPAEPDIPGIPPGSAVESLNYFLFLNDLRNSLPAGTSVSIAAPASFVSRFPS
jgi:chitinase